MRSAPGDSCVRLSRLISGSYISTNAQEAEKKKHSPVTAAVVEVKAWLIPIILVRRGRSARRAGTPEARQTHGASG